MLAYIFSETIKMQLEEGATWLDIGHSRCTKTNEMCVFWQFSIFFPMMNSAFTYQASKVNLHICADYAIFYNIIILPVK